MPGAVCECFVSHTACSLPPGPHASGRAPDPPAGGLRSPGVRARRPQWCAGAAQARRRSGPRPPPAGSQTPRAWPRGLPRAHEDAREAGRLQRIQLSSVHQLAERAVEDRGGEAGAEVAHDDHIRIDGAPRLSTSAHLGVAIALREGGLIAPAIHDADCKPLDELMSGLRDLVGRARSGGLRSSELTDPTITVTSGARRTMTASLAADHRASDGHQGSAFLIAIDHVLQNPEQL